jgi:DNA (cytosine-5)-methyltransferase 1
MFTFGSLFSGIGGLDLGLERAGMTCRWQCENDPYAVRVLTKHWPDVPKYPDVRTLDESNVERVDLLAGGFPCQPVSIAGRRSRQSDERWLWPEFARLIRDLRPRYALMENVPGLLTGGMGDVLGDLAGLGFDAEWRVLSAAQFGAPHLRRRVFIVAYSTRDGRQQGRPSTGQGLRQPGCRSHAPTDLHDALRGRHGAPQEAVFAGRDRPKHASWWNVEPAVGRVANGVPRRVDRLRGLGNAVVPQVAEWIGRRIVAAHEEVSA